MSRHSNMFLLVLLVAMWILNLPAGDNVPDLINYQGFITDKDGKSLSGDFIIKFSLYDREAGGDPLWQETHNTVKV